MFEEGGTGWDAAADDDGIDFDGACSFVSGFVVNLGYYDAI